MIRSSSSRLSDLWQPVRCGPLRKKGLPRSCEQIMTRFRAAQTVEAILDTHVIGRQSSVKFFARVQFDSLPYHLPFLRRKNWRPVPTERVVRTSRPLARLDFFPFATIIMPAPVQPDSASNAPTSATPALSAATPSRATAQAARPVIAPFGSE